MTRFFISGFCKYELPRIFRPSRSMPCEPRGPGVSQTWGDGPASFSSSACSLRLQAEDEKKSFCAPKPRAPAGAASPCTPLLERACEKFRMTHIHDGSFRLFIHDNNIGENFVSISPVYHVHILCIFCNYSGPPLAPPTAAKKEELWGHPTPRHGD